MNSDSRHDPSPNCKDPDGRRSARAVRTGCGASIRRWSFGLALLSLLALGCEERARQEREYKTDPRELGEALGAAAGRDEQLEVLALLAAVDDRKATTDPDLRASIRPMTGSADHLVAAKAAEVLSKWEDEAVIEPLLRLLDNPDPLIRISAASSLGILGNPATVPALASALDDDDENVQAQACRSLAELEEPLRGRPLELLRRRLADPHSSVRAAAAAALGRVGSFDDVIALRRLLADPIEGVVVAAADSLGRLGDRDSIPLLINLLKLGPQASQFAAAQSLGRIATQTTISDADDQRSLEALLAALRHKDTIIRGEAMRSLRDIGDDAALVPILEMAQDEDPLIQTYVPIVAGYLYRPRHFDLLMTYARSALPEARAAASFAMGVAGERRAIPKLLEGVRDQDHRVRMSSLSALGLLGAKEGIASIEDSFYNDPNPQVRGSAEVALVMARIAAPTLVARLILGLSSEVEGVRLAATTLLTALEEKKAVGAMRLLLEDENELIRKAAEYGVKHILDQ